MADKLQELSNRHIQLIAIGGAIGTGLFLGCRCINSFSRTFYITDIYYSWFYIIYVYESNGELLLSNSRFKSFGDIAHHHIGSMAGFMVG